MTQQYKYQVRTYWYYDDKHFIELYESDGKDEWDTLEEAEEVFDNAYTYWSGEAGKDLIGIAVTKTPCKEEGEEFEVIYKYSIDN